MTNFQNPPAGAPINPHGMIQPLQTIVPAGMPAPIASGVLQPQMPAMAPQTNPALSAFGQLPSTQAPVIPSNTLSSDIRIRKITLVETKTQRTQYARTYVPMVDGNTLRVLNNFKDQNPDMLVTASDVVRMQTAGAQFFQTSAQPGQQVAMENGWDTKRYTFTITVDVYFHNTLTHTEYVSGYTDYQGVNNVMGRQTLDPNMVFVITSVSRSAPRPVHNATNGIGHTINGSSYVIAPNTTPDFSKPNNTCLARPRDIFAELSVEAVRRGAEALAGMPASLSGSVPYLNMSTTVGNTPRLSNVDNNVATNYASKILSAAGVALSSPTESTNPYTIARSHAGSREEEYTSSFFVHMLDEKSGSFAGAVANSFTLGRLYGIDPALANSADDRIVVMPSDIFAREIRRTSTGQAITVPAGTECDSFSGTGRATADAIAIMFAATSAFRRAGVSYITCSLSNYSGQDQFAITSIYGIDDGLLAKRASDACQAIIRDTVLAVTRASQSYQIDLVVDINNDAYIKLAIGMQPSAEYVMPCFALASMSPVVGNQQSLDNVVTGVKDITTNLFQDGLTIGDFGGFNSNSVSY